MTTGRLGGKVAVITGAANGIGLAAARRFVAEGAKVLLVDRDEAALRSATDEIGDAATHWRWTCRRRIPANATWRRRCSGTAASTRRC